MAGNGHVHTHNIKRYPGTGLSLNKYFGLVKVRINEILYCNDPINNSYSLYGVKCVQYSATIMGGPFDGYSIKRIMDAGILGGINNSSVIIYGNTEQSKNLDPSLSDGDYALVLFLYGNLESGVIIKGFPHGRSNKYIVNSSEGKSVKFEYNGVYFNIDKNGKLSIVRGGLKNINGNTLEPDKAGQTILFNEDGSFQILGLNGSEILLDTSGGIILKTSGVTATFTSAGKVSIVNNNGTNLVEQAKDLADETSKITTLTALGIQPVLNKTSIEAIRNKIQEFI